MPMVVAVMRILLLCHGLPPESVGGVEQHVEGLSRALAAAGHHVHIYARTAAPDRAQGEFFVERSGNPTITRVAYRWQGIASLESIYQCEPMALSLRRFLAERRAMGEHFDVAHVHHLTGMSTDSIDELHAAGLPVVMTLHDYWLMCPRGQMWHAHEVVCERVEANRCGECLHHTYPHWLDIPQGIASAARIHERARVTIAKADCLVVPSARAIPPFLALGVSAERFTVVENGVDTTALEQLAPPPCGPGPLRLAYFGTILPSKGLHILIEAVRKQAPGTVSLAIHGNAVSYHGDDRFLLRCFQQLQPGDAIHYHGPYSTQDLPRLLAPVDVVCAPALWQEAFGLTVREALSAARPVVVSRIGGLQDAVTDGQEGLVLPPGDVAAWAVAIRSLAADRSLVRRMAAAARPRARGFSAMADDLTKVYARISAERISIGHQRS
ncbi:MAG: glycosyltransferase [Planctomycetes bacterium]|jgi:glycosyltransferase involved in cell wall biosynthesis|nr:glycosyltransferase [Planctomycetota bacterium]